MVYIPILLCRLSDSEVGHTIMLQGMQNICLCFSLQSKGLAAYFIFFSCKSILSAHFAEIGKDQYK